MEGREEGETREGNGKGKVRGRAPPIFGTSLLLWGLVSDQDRSQL